MANATFSASSEAVSDRSEATLYNFGTSKAVVQALQALQAKIKQLEASKRIVEGQLDDTQRQLYAAESTERRRYEAQRREAAFQLGQLQSTVNRLTDEVQHVRSSRDEMLSQMEEGLKLRLELQSGDEQRLRDTIEELQTAVKARDEQIRAQGHDLVFERARVEEEVKLRRAAEERFEARVREVALPLQAASEQAERRAEEALRELKVAQMAQQAELERSERYRSELQAQVSQMQKQNAVSTSGQSPGEDTYKEGRIASPQLPALSRSRSPGLTRVHGTESEIRPNSPVGVLAHPTGLSLHDSMHAQLRAAYGGIVPFLPPGPTTAHVPAPVAGEGPRVRPVPASMNLLAGVQGRLQREKEQGGRAAPTVLAGQAQVEALHGAPPLFPRSTEHRDAFRWPDVVPPAARPHAVQNGKNKKKAAPVPRQPFVYGNAHSQSRRESVARSVGSVRSHGWLDVDAHVRMHAEPPPPPSQSLPASLLVTSGEESGAEVDPGTAALMAAAEAIESALRVRRNQVCLANASVAGSAHSIVNTSALSAVSAASMATGTGGSRDDAVARTRRPSWHSRAEADAAKRVVLTRAMHSLQQG